VVRERWTSTLALWLGFTLLSSLLVEISIVGLLSCCFALVDGAITWLCCIGYDLLYKKRCWVFSPCVEGFPRLTTMLYSGVALEDSYGWVAMKEHCLWRNEQTYFL
jgi:hypothetical protein